MRRKFDLTIARTILQCSMTKCCCVKRYSRQYAEVIRRVCHSEDTFSAQFPALLFTLIVQWHKQLAASLSLRRHGFNHRPLHVRFVVYKMALEQVLLLLHILFVIIVIPPMLHIRSSPCSAILATDNVIK